MTARSGTHNKCGKLPPAGACNTTNINERGVCPQGPQAPHAGENNGTHWVSHLESPGKRVAHVGKCKPSNKRRLSRRNNNGSSRVDGGMYISHSSAGGTCGSVAARPLVEVCGCQ